MPLKIIKVLVDASGQWGVEIQNVGAGTLDLSDYYFGYSRVTHSGTEADVIGSLVGAPAILASGETLVIGSKFLPDMEATRSNLSPYGDINAYDGFFIAQVDPYQFIDSVGDTNSGASPFALNSVYTADPGRAQDTSLSDDFSATDDFAAATYCFAAGTLIATPEGPKPVERLAVGDPVVTADGRGVPVLWIGRQQLRKPGPVDPSGLVQIRAGALGDGLPHCDLTVTADHGMVLDGFVINASALVNGGSIDWVPSSELPETFTVYHVETEGHEVILANGAPSETFIDYRDRRAFDNFDEYLDLYGCERIIPEMHRPRISCARLLPEDIPRHLGLDHAGSLLTTARCA
jgi:hypothetical protein